MKKEAREAFSIRAVDHKRKASSRSAVPMKRTSCGQVVVGCLGAEFAEQRGYDFSAVCLLGELDVFLRMWGLRKMGRGAECGRLRIVGCGRRTELRRISFCAVIQSSIAGF